MAERGGFEPPIPLQVLRFSRPVQSTALPPLHPGEISIALMRGRSCGSAVLEAFADPRQWSQCRKWRLVSESRQFEPAGAPTLRDLQRGIGLAQHLARAVMPRRLEDHADR